MSPMWWEAIDQQLLHHLMSRTTQPGVSRPQLAQTILVRMQNMTRPLPLLADLTQRHAAAITGSADIPIVYAQPVRLNDQLHGGKSSGLSSAVATQHSLLV